MRHRLLEETPQFYRMHDGAAEFRVPKAGLSEAMHAKIRGYADGGKIQARGPKGEVLETDRDFIARRAAEQERRESRGSTYEEETGDPYRPHEKKPKQEPSTLAQISDFAKRAAGSIRGMAEGGGVELPERRDAGPVVFVPSPDGGLRPVPASQVAASFQPAAAAPAQTPMSTQAAAGPSPEAQAAVRQVYETTGPAGAAALGRLADEPGERAAAVTDLQQHERAKLTSLRPREEAVAPVAPAPAPAQPTAPVARGAGTTPDYGVGDMQAAVGAEQQALRDRGAAEAEQARAQAKVLGAVNEQLTANAIAEKTRREQARIEAQQLGAQREQLSSELRRMDMKVDPGRYWASKSTFQKILGGIGLALGAVGAGVDGVNRAALLMGQAIDRDLEAQKAEHSLTLQKGEQRASQLNSIYAQNRAIYQDDLASLAASKATALELADNQLKQAAASYASPIAKANAAALSAQLQQSIAKFKGQAAAHAEERRHHIALEGATAGKGNPTEQKELRTAEANAQDSLDLIRTIRGSLGRTQSAVPGVTAVKQNFGEEAPNIETAATQLTLKLKDMAKLGQISASDSSLLDKLIGDPQAVWGKGSSERSKQDRLKALEALVLRNIQNQRRASAGAQAR